MKRVIAGSAAFASSSSDGAWRSSLIAGPDSVISSDSAGVSSGATGVSAASDGLASPSVVFERAERRAQLRSGTAAAR